MTRAWLIRAATSDDAAVVQRIARAAYARYPEELGLEPAPLFVEYADEIANKNVQLVCASDDTVFGFLIVNTQDTFWIDQIAIDEQAQRRGFGTVLLRQAEQSARQAGFTHVYLLIHALMIDNQHWYTRHGYVEIDRRIDAGLDRVFFRKTLT